MLDAGLKTQLTQYLQNLRQPIELVASLDDSKGSTEMKALLEASAKADAGRTLELAARLRRRLAGRSHSDSAALLAEDRRR